MSSTLAPPRTPVFSPAAVVASCAGFVLIGALQALYGPAVPALREDYGLSPSGAGMALSMHFVGGVAGVPAMSAVPERLGNRVPLGASYALMVAGCLGFALSGSWPPTAARVRPRRSHGAGC